MFDTNLLIGLIAGGVSISSFVLIVQQARRLPTHPNVTEKLKRALIAGVSFLVCFVSGVVAMNYLSSPSIEKDWSVKVFLALLCVALPGAMLIMIGIYIWTSRSEATQQYFSRKLRELDQNSKKHK